MFKDIYTKVSDILYNKISHDNASNIIIDNNENILDKPKLAKKYKGKTQNKITPSTVCATDNQNDGLHDNIKSRKKSQPTMLKPLLVCEICNYKTYIKCNYKKHILSDFHKKLNKNKNTNINDFFCIICSYTTTRKNDYDKHMNTKKHILKNEEFINSNKNIQQPINTTQLLNSSFVDKHNMKININLLKEDITSIIIKELKDMTLEQNKLLLDIANKQNISSTINNNNHVNHNKQFNMNVFLNETCKDAMNLSEFLENLHVSMEDMEKTGELGFAKGMSRIIMYNLNALDVCKRPIHCSDVKRETLYIKNNGVWEKETEDKKQTKEIIYKVSCLNTKQLLKWRDLPRNKGYDNSEHSKNDEFMKLVMEVNKLREEEIDKVITSISKHVAIDKEKEKVKMSGYLNK
jgi:hypothetical protein